MNIEDYRDFCLSLGDGIEANMTTIYDFKAMLN